MIQTNKIIFYKMMDDLFKSKEHLIELIRGLEVLNLQKNNVIKNFIIISNFEAIIKWARNTVYANYAAFKSFGLKNDFDDVVKILDVIFTLFRSSKKDKSNNLSFQDAKAVFVNKTIPKLSPNQKDSIYGERMNKMIKKIGSYVNSDVDYLTSWITKTTPDRHYVAHGNIMIDEIEKLAKDIKLFNKYKTIEEFYYLIELFLIKSSFRKFNIL